MYPRGGNSLLTFIIPQIISLEWGEYSREDNSDAHLSTGELDEELVELSMSEIKQLQYQHNIVYEIS